MNTHDDTDRELRAAVRAYGADVRPSDRLGAIRARTHASTATGSRTGWWRSPWLLAGGAGVLAAGIIAAAVSAVSPPSSTDGVSGPSSTSETSVTIYTVGVFRDAWLFPEEVAVASTSDDSAVGAVEGLLQHDGSSGRSSPWAALPDSVSVRSVTAGRDRVVVDFSGPVDESPIPGEASYAYDPRLTVQQLAFTLRELPGFSDLPLVVTCDGEPVDRVLGIELGPRPVLADPAVLSPILIDSPVDGATVSGPVRVTGTSDTFEANVAWEVLRGDRAVEQGAAMGGSYGERRPFRFRVRLAPGDYTIRAYELSAEDGGLVTEDTKTVTVE